MLNCEQSVEIMEHKKRGRIFLAELRDSAMRKGANIISDPFSSFSLSRRLDTMFRKSNLRRLMVFPLSVLLQTGERDGT